MTAKQHEALAAAFKAFFAKNYPGMENETVRQHLLIGGWQPTLDRVCAVLLADNHKFDKQRFLKECGVE